MGSSSGIDIQMRGGIADLAAVDGEPGVTFDCEGDVLRDLQFAITVDGHGMVPGRAACAVLADGRLTLEAWLVRRPDSGQCLL